MKQEQRTATARALLVSAAADLVGQGGFVQASVEQIGQHAGMSRGAVNYHFGSKVNLLESVLDDRVDDWGARAVRLRDDPGSAALAGLLDAHWMAWSTVPDGRRVALMVLYEAIGPSPFLQPRIRRFTRDLTASTTAALSAFQEAGQVRTDIDTAVAAQTIAATFLGLLAEQELDGDLDAHAAYRELRATALARWAV